MAAAFEEIPATTYAVEISSAENGTATPDKTEAAEGETVQITLTPNPGYRIAEEPLSSDPELTFTKVSGDETGAVWSFTMPAEDVYIAALFEETPPYTISCTGFTFVQDGDSAYEQYFSSDYGHVYLFSESSEEIGTQTADAGETITFWPDLQLGWVLGSDPAVTDAKGNTVEVSYDSEDDSWSFTMPARSVTLALEITEDTTDYGIDTSPVDEESGWVFVYDDGQSEKINTARAGDKLLFSVVPYTGWELDSDGLIVMYEEENYLDLEYDESKGMWTATMPASDVTVYASFVRIAYTVTVSVSGDDGSFGGAIVCDSETGEETEYTDGSFTAYYLDDVTLTFHGATQPSNSPEPTPLFAKVTLSGADEDTTPEMETEDYTLRPDDFAYDSEHTFVMRDSDVTASVVFKNGYKITYESDYADGETRVVMLETSNLTLPECDFDPPSGKHFLIWEVKEGQYDAVRKSPGEQYLSVVEEVTVTAVWGYQFTLPSDPEGCTISFYEDRICYEEEEWVMLFVDLEDRYTVASLKLITSSGEIDITNDYDNDYHCYYFAMPDSDAEVVIQTALSV